MSKKERIASLERRVKELEERLDMMEKAATRLVVPYFQPLSDKELADMWRIDPYYPGGTGSPSSVSCPSICIQGDEDNTGTMTVGSTSSEDVPTTAQKDGAE